MQVVKYEKRTELSREYFGSKASAVRYAKTIKLKKHQKVHIYDEDGRIVTRFKG